MSALRQATESAQTLSVNVKLLHETRPARTAKARGSALLAFKFGPFLWTQLGRNSQMQFTHCLPSDEKQLQCTYSTGRPASWTPHPTCLSTHAGRYPHSETASRIAHRVK